MIDPDVFLRGFLDAHHRSVVDPRCDDCGASLPPQGTLLGPFQCDGCKAINAAERERWIREYDRAERPDRRVHVVKLPADFR